MFDLNNRNGSSDVSCVKKHVKLEPMGQCGVVWSGLGTDLTMCDVNRLIVAGADVVSPTPLSQ